MEMQVQQQPRGLLQAGWRGARKNAFMQDDETCDPPQDLLVRLLTREMHRSGSLGYRTWN